MIEIPPVAVGQQFGKLKALRILPRKSGSRKVRVACSCGHEFVVKQAKLVKGEATNCGSEWCK